MDRVSFNGAASLIEAEVVLEKLGGKIKVSFNGAASLIEAEAALEWAEKERDWSFNGAASLIEAEDGDLPAVEYANGSASTGPPR